MADLKDVIDAMVTRLQTAYAGATIAGRIYGFAPDSIVPPCIVVVPSTADFLDYDTTFEGKDDITLTVKVIVDAQATQAGQQALMAYFSRSGSLSLLAALYGGPTLGGTVADMEILTASGWGDVEWAGVVYFGAELGVKVYT